MPLFLQLRLFRLFRVLIADLHVMSQVIKERMNLEGLEDQESLQRRPKITQHRQNPRPKSKHQKSTKRSVEEANGPGGTEPTTG